MNPTYDEILKAESMRGEDIKKTPLIHSHVFSEITGSEIYLKAEFHQDGFHLFYHFQLF